MTKAAASSQDFFKDFSKENLFRILLNQVDYSVCFKDKDHRYMLCSSSFARLLGYKTPDELVGKDLLMEQIDIPFSRLQLQVGSLSAIVQAMMT